MLVLEAEIKGYSNPNLLFYTPILDELFFFGKRSAKFINGRISVLIVGE